MLYKKNVTNKEIYIRFLGGSVMVLCGIFGLQASQLGLLVAGVGVVTIVTGLVGFCPACAIGGRKSTDNK